MDSFFRTGRSISKRRAGILALWALAAIMAGGCGSSEPTAKAGPAPPKTVETETVSETPEDLLHAQLRSGAFQLSAAAGSIEDSLVAAQEASQALRKNRDHQEAMFAVADFIDSAGSGISEFTDEPPILEEIAKNFAAFDERRLKAVEASNDALQDLRQALGLLEGLAEETDKDAVKWATGVKALIAVALDDIWGAIEAFGGTPEAMAG